MSKSISIDIGNTQISLGIFNDEKIINSYGFSVADFNKDNFSLFLSKIRELKDIDNGLISSVVPSITLKVKESIEDITKVEIPILKNEDNKFVSLLVDNPSEVGSDLIADLVAAKSIYGYPCLIIDFGTLTKNLLIDRKGNFVKASFTPGFDIAFRSMSEKAELISSYRMSSFSKDYLGSNTFDAMSSGVYYSQISSALYLIKQVKKDYGEDTKVIITGGFSNLLNNELKEFIIDKDLTLKGIHIINETRK